MGSRDELRRELCEWVARAGVSRSWLAARAGLGRRTVDRALGSTGPWTWAELDALLDVLDLEVVLVKREEEE